jgi:hypothetical protein
VAFDNAFTLSPRTPKDTGSTSKEKVFVDFHEFFLPEVVLIKDVGAEDLGCDPSSKVFETLSSEATFDGGVILGILACIRD